MASENDANLSEGAALHEASLESILAEYKGSAYINGDKRTPPELLNDQTDRILREALKDMLPEEMLPAPRLAGGEDPLTDGMSAFEDGGMEPETAAYGRYGAAGAEEMADEAVDDAVGDAVDDAAGFAPEEDEDKDSVVLFFESYRSPEPEPGPETEADEVIIQDVEKAIERELSYEEESGEFADLSFGIVERPGFVGDELVSDEDESEMFIEPELKDTVRGFAERLNSISIRLMPAAIITLIMVIVTFAAEAGKIIPFGIGRDESLISGALVIMLLVVMMLCVDLVVRGARDLVRGAPNAETLILFSCAFSIISAVFAMLTETKGMLPYCAVSAVSCTMAAFGERLSLRAITETLKTAVASSEPYGVQAEYNEEIDKSVLKKVYNRTDGFYSNLMHPDVSETVYRFASPILLASALVLSAITVAAEGGGEYFLHTLSALLAATAPFSALLTFSVPFGIVAKSMRKSGVAIAGWGGVDDIWFTDGTSVTDDDLFPPGTLSFKGVKIYEGVTPEKAIRYTASLIMASGSGLSRIYSEVLETQKMEPVRVDDFKCYEGGIGARIQGEYVMTGSAAFMNLLSIRVPDDMNMKNAVFTAIDNQLIALFVVEYLPVNSVQSALISMLKWRIKLFSAMRDFNITPLMLEQKFKVSLDDFEYTQTKDSYSISDSHSVRQGRIAALLAREGLGPYAESITGGRLLRSAAMVATVVSVISAALGVIFMFYMCWNSSFISAKPGNLLLFMLSTLAAALIVCGYVKCRK